MGFIVKKVKESEIHTDTIRVHENYRISKGKPIDSGTICKVTVKENEYNSKKSVYVILRGQEEELDNKDIFIDESLRKKLGVKSGKEYDFSFTDCSWFAWLPWMLNTTDVGYKIASRIAIISLVISLPGLFSLAQSLVKFILNIFC